MYELAIIIIDKHSFLCEYRSKISFKLFPKNKDKKSYYKAEDLKGFRGL